MPKINLYMPNETSSFFTYESSIIPMVGDTYAAVATPANTSLKVVSRQLMTSEASLETILIIVQSTYSK